MVLSSPVREGRGWFGGRIPLPLNPNLGSISTMPPEGYKPSYAGAGAYGGYFDQKDAGQGSRVYLPVLSELERVEPPRGFGRDARSAAR